MNDTTQLVITLIISAIVPSFIALVANYPAWKAARNQETEIGEKRKKLEDEITTQVLERADLYLDKQEQRHKREMEQLTTEYQRMEVRYKEMVKSNAVMANAIEEHQKENEKLKIAIQSQGVRYEAKLTEQKELYEKQIAELQKQISELQKRIKTGPFSGEEKE